MNETFKVAVRTLTSDVVEILAHNNIASSAIKHFVPHQANYRIIKAVGDALELTDEQVVLTVAKYGNTSGASIPMAINDIVYLSADEEDKYTIAQAKARMAQAGIPVRIETA